MITKDEAYDIISSLNEDAFEYCYDLWQEAEEDEELKEEASFIQQETFRDLFYEEEEDVQEAVWHYVETDESFADDFNAWHGKD